MTTHNQLHAYLDGELTPAERHRVEAWLAEDAEARRELDALRQIRNSVQAAPTPAPDVEAAWKALSKKLNGSPAKRTIPFPVPLTAAAAIALLGLVLWSSFPGREPTPSPQPVVMVETDLEDSTPIVYLDEESGWTIVWVEPNTVDLMPTG